MEHNVRKPHGSKYYVTPHKDGWAVKCEERQLVAYSYDNVEKAMHTAADLAIEHKADVIVKGKDGHVQEVLTFNN